MPQTTALMSGTRCTAGGLPDKMRKIPTVSDLRLTTVTEFQQELSEHVTAAFEQNTITVVAWHGRPEGVLMSMEYWNLGRERRPVDDMLVERLGTRAARPRMRAFSQELRRGKHAIMSVWREDRAVFAPYEWTRQAFPEWDLPANERTPDTTGPCVQVVYRKSQTAQDLRAEFADALDPDWEVDRRLSSTRAQIPPERRAQLRGVVYVEDGVIVRIRALNPADAWEDLPDSKISLAPVSAPLTAQQIDQQLPTLKLHPGDRLLASQGAPREYHYL